MEEEKSNKIGLCIPIQKHESRWNLSLSRHNVEKLSLILIPLEFGKVPTRKKLTSVDVKGGHGRGAMNSLIIHSKLKSTFQERRSASLAIRVFRGRFTSLDMIRT